MKKNNRKGKKFQIKLSPMNYVPTIRIIQITKNQFQIIRKGKNKIFDAATMNRILEKLHSNKNLLLVKKYDAVYVYRIPTLSEM